MKKIFLVWFIMGGLFLRSFSQAEELPDSPPTTKWVDPALSELMETSQRPASAAGFVYDPIGKRDPFTPDKEIIATTSTTQVPVISLPSVDPTVASPLQLQDAATFVVKAILWDTISPKAVLQDRAGVLHIVRRDVRVGIRQGYVAAIREREVVIAEPAVIDGKKSMQSIVLSFQTDPGAKR